jgi:hypothetical protein
MTDNGVAQKDEESTIDKDLVEDSRVDPEK